MNFKCGTSSNESSSSSFIDTQDSSTDTVSYVAAVSEAVTCTSIGNILLDILDELVINNNNYSIFIVKSFIFKLSC